MARTQYTVDLEQSFAERWHIYSILRATPMGSPTSGSIPPSNKTKSQNGIPVSPRTPSPMGSKGDIDTYGWSQQPVISSAGSDEQELLRIAPLDPLITKQALKVLEIGFIVNQVPLRFDINHSRELIYRKMDDPESKLKNQQYWEAIKIELKIFSMTPVVVRIETKTPDPVHEVTEPAIKPRLPVLLQTTKELLETILPKSESSELQKVFDVRLIIQEVISRCCNFFLIAQGLADLLLRHCAPMRDERVKAMVQMFSNGDLDSITNGLQEVLLLLELLRLDSVNHLLRHFKPHFIEATQTFGIRYWGNKIIKGKFDPRPAQEWFRDRRSQLKQIDLIGTSERNQELFIFVHAVIRHIMLGATDQLPKTFGVDLNRLKPIEKTILEMIYFRTCQGVFENVVESESKAQGRRIIISKQEETKLCRSMEEASREMGSVCLALEDIAAEMARVITVSRDITKTRPDTGLIDKIEGKLKSALNSKGIVLQDEQVAILQKEQDQIHADLTRNVFRISDSLLNAPLFEIFNKLVPQSPNIVRIPTAETPKDNCTLHGDGYLLEICNRLAHIVLLHWRIFAPLIYLNDPLD